jgi:myo-inositol-1(or 4)-monophosphatase
MYKKELKIAKEAALNAGKILKKLWKSDYEINNKSDNSPVTIADLESEKEIIKIIKKSFPEDNIISEENSIKSKSDRTWLIDPLDGTINFIEGNKEFCICISFLDKENLVIGVVYAPIQNKFYFASKNNGAYLNNNKIKVSKKKTLKDSTIVLSKHIGGENEIVKKFSNTIKLGSSALRNCLIAEGKAEAHIYSILKKSRLNSWDISASDLILQEAGGKITDLKGNEINYANIKLNKGIISSNGFIHKQLI